MQNKFGEVGLDPGTAQVLTLALTERRASDSALREVPLMCRWGVQHVKVMLFVLFADYVMNFTTFMCLSNRHKTTTGGFKLRFINGLHCSGRFYLAVLQISIDFSMIF